MSNEISTLPEVQLFELAQREAACYAASTLVPLAYQGNVSNVMIAMNMAKRMGADPLMVMQNLHVVHGTPSWSSKFMIAGFNQLKAYTTIKYEFRGTEGHSDRGCRASCTEKCTSERLEGPWVTMTMAKDEGWSTKKGSKWKTIPELMLCYRAAAFFIRITAPEVTMGLLSREEAEDMKDAPAALITDKDYVPRPDMEKPEEVEDAEVVEVEASDASPEKEQEAEAFGPVIDCFGECSDEYETTDQWAAAIIDMLKNANGSTEVKNIFKNNNALLDALFEASPTAHDEVMEFTPAPEKKK